MKKLLYFSLLGVLLIQYSEDENPNPNTDDDPNPVNTATYSLFVYEY
jgi:hypothetical protein